MNERLDSELNDLFFRVLRNETRRDELFSNFDFDRQTVRVPTGFPLAHVALHGRVARIEVFDRAREAVARMRHPVRRRRAFVEHKSTLIVGPAAAKRFLIDVAIAPTADNQLFVLRKISALTGIRAAQRRLVGKRLFVRHINPLSNVRARAPNYASALLRNALRAILPVFPLYDKGRASLLTRAAADFSGVRTRSEPPPRNRAEIPIFLRARLTAPRVSG